MSTQNSPLIWFQDISMFVIARKKTWVELSIIHLFQSETASIILSQDTSNLSMLWKSSLTFQLIKRRSVNKSVLKNKRGGGGGAKDWDGT